MALVGFKPFGQNNTQFIIPRQRNKLNGSSKRAKRARVSVSRLSTAKRFAFNSADGPKNLSGFHQTMGKRLNSRHIKYTRRDRLTFHVAQGSEGALLLELVDH